MCCESSSADMPFHDQIKLNILSESCIRKPNELILSPQLNVYFTVVYANTVY